MPIFMFAMQDKWAQGFWLVLVALLTDFLDGLAAKKLDAVTRLGAELDPLADFSLAAAGIAGLTLSGHFPVWAAAIMLFVALLIGYERFFWPKDTRLHQLRPLFSVTYLFGSWIFMVWAFATLAYGWSWLYIACTAGALLAAALLKRHRLRAWLSGLRK